MAELWVDESANAEVPQTLIAYDELPVRERSAGPDFPHRALVIRGDAKHGTRRIRKHIRCRVLHAHSKIRRRHFNIPMGKKSPGGDGGARYHAPRGARVTHSKENAYLFRVSS
jgi:hypothetical protein